MDSYKAIFGTKRFVGSQPITFTRDTYKKDANYYLTYKLDGLRKFLLFTVDRGILIGSKLDIKKFRIPIRPELNGTVLDTEFVDNKLYVFDILFYKGIDVRKLGLEERLHLIKEVISILKSKRIFYKEYESPGNTCKTFFDLKDRYADDMKTGKVDGIIFTPDIDYIKGVPLKWKPTHLLSIDFKIKKIGDNKVQLLLQNDQVYSPKGKYKGVGTTRLTDSQYKKYNDGDVVEFVFINKKFVPIRVRKDKIMSNHLKVVVSNFKAITQPPNMSKILQCSK